MSVAAVLSGEARAHVAHARAEDFLETIPDGSVNLLWADFPYFRVVDEPWDRAWVDESAFLAWVESVVASCDRVLAPNGSLYLFASPQMAGRVEGLVAQRLRVLNALVWAKPWGAHRRQSPAACRLWFPRTERVVFAEKRGHLGGSVLGDVLQSRRRTAGLTQDQLDVAIGRTRSADPTKGSGLVRLQEAGERLPNADDWTAAMRALGDDRLEESVRAEFTALLRPFEAPADFTDVWTYEPVAPGDAARHPCEKPPAMCADVLQASSRHGDVVLDLFGGSCRMAEAALPAGRRYLACDLDPHWAEVGRRRAEAAAAGTMAAVPSRPRASTPSCLDATKQRGLFDGGAA